MASLSGVFNTQEFTDLGELAAGYRLYTYTAGTTTHKTAYTDSAEAVPHVYTADGIGGQYIALNARGEIPAPLFLAAGPYDIALHNVAGAPVWTRRAVPSSDAVASLSATLTAWIAQLATSLGASIVGFLQAGASAVLRTVQDKLRENKSPYDFGAVGDGTTDDTAALQAWASAAGNKVGAPATFKVSGQITFAVNTLNLDARGMVIDASAGGTFTDSSVVYCTGSLTALPALSASPTAWSRTLAFATAHGLAEGDVGIIYNPADYSWNSSFTYSRAGEFFRVAYVTDSTNLKTSNPLYAGYTAADVDLYSMAENKVSISGLAVIAHNSGNIRPIRIRLATRVRLDKVHGYGSNAMGLDLDRCFDVDIGGANVDNTKQLAAATYGLSIGNCQAVRVHHSQLNATRHAVNIGGDDFTGSVPNRDVKIESSTLRNDSALSSIPCADIHANCEGITYEGNTIFGGASWGGKDAAYINNEFVECDVSVGAMIQGGSQWAGGYAKALGNTFRSNGAYANGLIRLFTDATNTVHDSHLIVRDNIASMGACDVFARLDNSHATLKANAHVSGVTFLDAASLNNVLRVSGTGAGDYAVVDDIIHGKAGASLYVEAGGYVMARVLLMKQFGSASVALTSGAAFSSVAATFHYSYGSKVPSVSAMLDTRIANAANPLGVAYRLKAATGVTFDIFTTNNANAGATPTVTVDYVAGVSEG